MAAFKDFLFNDKLRGLVTFITLFTILVMICISYWFPKENKVDQETIRALQEVTTQIERAANSLRKQSELTDKANKELTRQLEEMEYNRHENYKELLEKYGLEVPDFTTNKELRKMDNLLSAGWFSVKHRMPEEANN